MEFKELTDRIQRQFDKMCQTGNLYISSIDGDKIWETYLNGFNSEENPIFRDPESTQHNCNLCNNFIRRYGNIIAIDSKGKILTLFDVEAEHPYKNTMKKLSTLLTSSRVSNLFMETYEELNNLPYEKTKKSATEFKLGLAVNYKQYTKEEAAKYSIVKAGQIEEFHHFNLTIPAKFIDKSGKSNAAILGEHHSRYQVLFRALTEFSIESLNIGMELIEEGHIADGAQFLLTLKNFKELKKSMSKIKKIITGMV
jgi:hypothetical protein